MSWRAWLANLVIHAITDHSHHCSSSVIDAMPICLRVLSTSQITWDKGSASSNEVKPLPLQETARQQTCHMCC